MSRIACIMAAVAVAALIAPDLASAQSDTPAPPRVRTRPAAAPPPPAAFRDPSVPGVFTTEQKRANTYQTYTRGSSGCIDDLGNGRIKYGCD